MAKGEGGPYKTRKHIHGATKLVLHRTPLLPAPYDATIPVCGAVNTPWSGIANTIAHLRPLRFSRNLHFARPRSGVFHDKRAQPFVIIY
jgi:hypothetical protein